jgi:4-aminobutyrate aminotransferase-like enzyme
VQPGFGRLGTCGASLARHHNPVSCAVAHAVLKVIKAGRRLVLISAREMKGGS